MSLPKDRMVLVTGAKFAVCDENPIAGGRLLLFQLLKITGLCYDSDHPKKFATVCTFLCCG